MALKGADGGEQDNENGEDDRPEAETVTQSSEESLLSLVQPELVALSKSWLAALKDHALLSLPPGKTYYAKCLFLCLDSLIQEQMNIRYCLITEKHI